MKRKTKKQTALSKISDETLVRWFQEMGPASRERIWRASVKKPFVKYKDQKSLKEHRVLMEAFYNGSIQRPGLSKPSIWSWLRAKIRKITMWRKIARVKNDVRGNKTNPYVTNNIPPKKYLVKRRSR